MLHHRNIAQKHNPVKSSGKVNESNVSVNSTIFLLSTVNLLLSAHTVICYWIHKFSNINASSNITN